MGALSFMNFYPNDISVTWTCGHTEIQSEKTVSKNPDGTFNSNTKCNIPKKYLLTPVRVTWNHGTTKVPEYREISVQDPDFPWRPVIKETEKPTLLVNTEVRLQYIISGYFPDYLAVTWYTKENSGHNTFSVTKHKTSITSTQKQPDNTYSCTASLIFTPLLMEHQGSEFICRVGHPSLVQPIQRSTGALHVKDFLSRPEMDEIQTPDLLLDKQTQLQCTVSRYYPGDLTVTWYKKGRGNKELIPMSDNETKKLPIRRSQQQSDKTFTYTACLVITPSLGDQGSEFICRVKHPSLEQPAERSTGLVQVQIKPKLQQPIQLSISDTGDVMGSLSLLNFSPKDITVTWTCGHTKIQSEETVSENPDGTFTSNTKCNIPVTLLINPVRVTWKHGTMKVTKYTEISVRDPEFPWRPVIEEIDKPFLLVNTEVRFQYKISGYFPDDLTVTWYKKENRGRNLVPVTKHNTSITGAQKQPDNTYSCTASLVFTPLLMEHQGSEFICTVGHLSLVQPIERSTGALQVNDFVSRPEMEEIQTPVLLLDKHTQLQCTVSRYYPDDLTVTWYKKERGNKELIPMSDNETKKLPIRRSQQQRDKTFTYTACLVITPSLGDQGSEFICRVEHPSLEQPIERSTGPVQVQVKPKLQQPIQLTISDSGDVMGSLSVLNFYPKDITVTWTCGHTEMQSQETVSKNPDGTFTSNTKCNIPVTLLINPVRVTWKHGTMEVPEHRELSVRDPDFPWRPVIEEIDKPVLLLNTEVRLQYKISGYFPDDLTVTWYKKKNRYRKMVSVTKHKTSIIGAQKQPDNTYSCTACLIFTPLLMEHQGSEFICRVKHPSLVQPIERSTRPLQVKIKPKLQQPIQLSISDSGDMMGSLSVLNFYPKDMSVTWTCGHTEEMQPEETVSENPDGTFTSNTKCNIPVTLLINPVRVTWKHKTMEDPEYREISVQHPDFPWRPRIEDMTPLVVQKNQTSTLSCRISAYFPEDLKVTWLEKKGQSECDCAYNTLYNIPPITPVRLADNSWTCSPALSFTPTSVYEGLEFICRVEHPSLENPIELSTGPARENVPPQVEEHVKFTLCEPDHVLCSMSLMKFYPQNINITWTYENQNNTMPSTKKIIQTNDETKFDATSECKVPWKYFQSLVRVTWSHESLTGHQHRDVRITEFPWRPVIEEIDKPTLLVNTEVRLQYKISGYFPDDLTVTWYKKENKGRNLVHVTKHKTSITGTQKQPDNTYSCTASLIFTPLLMEHQGSEFICRVGHPSLVQPIERRTGALHVKNFLSRPEMGEIQTPDLLLDKQTHLQCTVSRYYPDDLTVTWYKKGRGNKELIPMSDNETKKLPIHQSQQQRDKTFTYTACLVITPSLEDQGSEFICRVEHPSLEQAIERSTGLVPVQVKPKLHQPIQLSISDSGDVMGSLSLWNFYPKDITVTWTCGHTKIQSEETVSENPDGTFTSNTKCNIPVTLLINPVRVIWKHGTMEVPEYTEISVRDPDYPWRPVIEEIDKPALLVNTEVRLQYKISGYFPDDLTVTWYKKENRGHNPVPVTKHKTSITGAQKQPDNTYSCTASLVITPLLMEHQGSEFICRVEHPSLVQPIERSTGALQVKMAPEVIEPVRFSICSSGEVLCSLSLKRFYPRSITVKWTSGEQRNTITSENKITESEGGKTFDIISQCRLPQDFKVPVYVTWEHESLPQPQRTMLTTAESAPK
ncbi:uncharacterized protein LOC142098455 [Mixophyes fleayi]|uniref:uncharacterized protein LOC142098455 n=1 Tax=Mixophyes fleayi TaxID=3061075 RepID=UPI003F4DC86D